MSESVQAFYDDLAADYHEMYADWTASIRRQALALDALIRGQATGVTTCLLDCSCGIGTQAIGLAELGYEVHATDLSPEAVERARDEVAKAGVHIEFGVADFRSPSNVVSSSPLLPHAESKFYTNHRRCSMPAINSFAEIADLNDAQIQVLLGEVEIWDLIAAVRDEEAKAVKARLFSVMAPKVQTFAQEELDVNKVSDPEKTRDAQLRMVSLASRLS